MIRRSLAFAALVCMLVPTSDVAGAEDALQLTRVRQVRLDEIVPATDGSRQVDLYLRAETTIGEPIAGVPASALTIRDNGELIDPEDIDLSVLSEVGVGTSAVLVLDTSATMRGDSFDQAQAAALQFMGRMGEFDHVAVVRFDDAVELVADFGEARNEARFKLENLRTQTRTSSKLVWDAVHRASKALRSRPAALPRRAFVVVVFSDGRDSNSGQGLEDVILHATGGPNEGRMPIFTIGYPGWGEQGLADLERLSSETSGASIVVRSPKQAFDFMDEIWERMTGSLVARFPGEMDGKLHSVLVTIGKHSDSREITYPDIPPVLWPYAVALAAALVAAGAAVFFLRSGSGGRLVYEGGPKSGKIVSLPGSGKVKVGALDSNDVVLDFETVSRFHAQLFVRRRKLEVEDLGSTNGTFVNDTPIRTRCEVALGDRVRFGEIAMVYRK